MTPRSSRPGTSHPVTAPRCSHHSPAICQPTFPACNRLARSAFVQCPLDEIATAIARCAGCHPDGVATVGSIDSGEREPSITGAIRYGAAARSSSTVEHQLRCRSRISSPSIWRQIMRTAVLQETPVPGRTSRRRRTVHVSHSRYAGLHRQSPSSSQPPGEMHVLPFCSSH